MESLQNLLQSAKCFGISVLFDTVRLSSFHLSSIISLFFFYFRSCSFQIVFFIRLFSFILLAVCCLFCLLFLFGCVFIFSVLRLFFAYQLIPTWMYVHGSAYITIRKLYSATIRFLWHLFLAFHWLEHRCGAFLQRFCPFSSFRKFFSLFSPVCVCCCCCCRIVHLALTSTTKSKKNRLFKKTQQRQDWFACILQSCCMQQSK